MPCSTRCNKAPRRAAAIATKSCCGVRGASIDTFMVRLRCQVGGVAEIDDAETIPPGHTRSQNFFTFRDDWQGHAPETTSPPNGGLCVFAADRGRRLADLAAPDGFEAPNA